MEYEMGEDAERIPPYMGEMIIDAVDNLTSSDITNYTHNFMDVGVTESLSTATTRLVDAAFSIIANATTMTATATVTTTTMTPTLLSTEIPAIRLEHAPQLSTSSLVKVYVLSVMALLSLLGNILTMVSIYRTRFSRTRKRHTWSAIYSLIFHLSIADVLVTGFCLIGEAVWYYTVQWLADEITCKLVKLFQMFSLYLSTYVLVLIGVDRWIAVRFPMKSLNMAKRCYRLLGGTYILSFLLSLPQFFIFHIVRGPFIEEFHQCVTYGSYSAHWQEQLYTTFTLVFTFLLPLCILSITYLSSFCTISSSEKMFQGYKENSSSNKPSTQTNRQRLIHKAKMKSLRISVVIIIAFLVCWTPYNVMMIIFMFLNPDKRLSDDLQSAIFFFGMSNSLVNPLIYGAFHLCPMKRKASKSGGNNNAHSLNRGDSQRTPSMLTAVTQADNNGRNIRTCRQSSYNRTYSNGSNSNCNNKELVSLLQITPTPTLTRKAASLKQPHVVPLQHSILHTVHSEDVICNGGGGGGSLSLDGEGVSGNGGGGNSSSSGSGCGDGIGTVLYSFDNNKRGVATIKMNNTFSSAALSGGNNVLVINNNHTAGNAYAVDAASLRIHHHGRLARDENVSSV